jgi:hypothetical protein
MRKKEQRVRGNRFRFEPLPPRLPPTAPSQNRLPRGVYFGAVFLLLRYFLTVLREAPSRRAI